MFSPREFLDFVKKQDIKRGKWQKQFRAYLKSKDFYGWIFNPSKDQLVDYAGLTDQIYGSICEDIEKLELLTELINDAPRDYGRATAAFLFSIVNYGFDTADAAFKNVDSRYANKELSRSEADKKNKKISEYCDVLNDLNSALLQIIKHDAKRLSRETGLPKHICKMALKQIPDPIFITNAKVGVYLNLILTNIYKDIDSRDCDIEDIKWKRFFDELFGDDARFDVASFILLETPEHIGSLSSKNVRKVWDSLTAFALNVLERADDNSRGQTLEIYLKRLAKALESKDGSVRVDLRSLSEREYPNLTKTVCRYHDKFDELFKPFSAASLLD